MVRLLIVWVHWHSAFLAGQAQITSNHMRQKNYGLHMITCVHNIVHVNCCTCTYFFPKQTGYCNILITDKLLITVWLDQSKPRIYRWICYYSDQNKLVYRLSKFRIYFSIHHLFNLKTTFPNIVTASCLKLQVL